MNNQLNCYSQRDRNAVSTFPHIASVPAQSGIAAARNDAMRSEASDGSGRNAAATVRASFCYSNSDAPAPGRRAEVRP